MKALKNIHTFVVSYGPALFIIGAVIGTGSVSSLVWAGTEHGMSLLWALLLSCLFFWVLISVISRVTFATGETFVQLVKGRFGRLAALYVVFAIVVSQFTSNIGVIGILSEAFATWLGLDVLGVSIFFSMLIYALIVAGKYATFERVLIFFVTVLGISFLVNVFLAAPDAGSILRGFVPTVPRGGAMITGAMVGTTLAGSVIVMRSYVVHEKGWGLEQLKHAEHDAALSGALIFLVSTVIMACAAATLHVRGMHIENAIDMAFALSPLMGDFAATLFVVGIVAAGISSAFPNALVSIWCITDYFEWTRNPEALHMRLLALPFCAAGVIAPLVGGRPVFLQIMSLALQAIFLPLLILFLVVLSNRKDVVGAHVSTRFVTVMCVVTFLFSLFMAYQAYVGLSDLVNPAR